jgi:carboxypeptidase C (cathepsin A)
MKPSIAVAAIVLCFAVVVTARIFPPTAGQQYSGYLTADVTSNAQMFYWFFEAANSSAPIILWLEGGPGFSGMFQVFQGMGPYRISEKEEISYNEFTWNKRYNLLFVDNPCGVGYSTVNPGQEVTNEKDMARQLYNALQDFFVQHPQYKLNDFYVFGESYGGKYAPAIADYIQQQNVAISASKAKNYRKSSRDNIFIYLKGIGIGNGLTDPINQVQTYADFFYNIGLYGLKEKAMAEAQQQKFVDHYNRGDFGNASITYWEIVMNGSALGGYIYYDYTCEMECIVKNYMWGPYGKLLNTSAAKSELNVPHNVSYLDFGPAVTIALFADFSQSMSHVFSDLLKDYRVLLFQGSRDTVVTTVGADAWLSKIDWPLMPQFQQAPRTPVRQGYDVVALVRTYDKLTQYVIPDSGHFVTAHKPQLALDMVHKFIENIPFT